jgi:hypothetical protein
MPGPLHSLRIATAAVVPADFLIRQQVTLQSPHAAKDQAPASR